MTSAYEPPLNSDFLLVKLDVQRDRIPEFQRDMASVRDGVFTKPLGWKLLRSAQRIDPKSDNELERFVHLWQTPTPINLWEAQFNVAADEKYAELYRMIGAEEQNILRIPAVYAPTKAFDHDPNPEGVMAIQELPLNKDWSDVLSWQWTLPRPVGNGEAAPNSDIRFSVSFVFQSVTGKLRSHFHFYEAAQNFSLDALTRDSVSTSPTNALIDRFVPLPRSTNAGLDRLTPSEALPMVTRGPIELFRKVVYKEHPDS
jgi:hypothetical protein